MNDYKEIIKELRKGYVLHENYNGEPEIIHRPSPTDKEAADAIEQLVKERDAAIADLKYLPFTTCKWVNTDRCKNSCLCERYEWRGVQE